ncbi:MAG: CPBP family intramembrane metalloprotease [Bacteroidaceae bacterium]|nr:CPBP family intramembrane metalloprotease [Bacteroidaceae bacterium]
MKKYLILLAKLIVFALATAFFMAALTVPFAFSSVVDVNNPERWAVLAIEGIQLVSVLLAAWLIIHYWDELSFVDDMGYRWRYKGMDLLWGFIVAAAIYAVGFIVSLLAGWISVEGVHFDFTYLLLQFLLYILVALMEESMMRGFVLGHMLDVGMNKFLSLLISSILFACLHLGNPGITNFALLNLTLAGVLLGVAYIYTRNLWFPIFLHLFWNFIQGPILGYEVSGTGGKKTLLKLGISDNTLMNGGDFGFEGSLPCTILMIVATGLIIYWFETKKTTYEEAIVLVDESVNDGPDDNDGTGTAVG